jgi:hypothetical protein
MDIYFSNGLAAGEHVGVQSSASGEPQVANN